ncbi:hypothetical protein PR048_025414 [Dryococelus australis]|uniref:Uncharacterized protein n=1 Tax=Dryococelus australis TaxID=614101 RepID=A0ABQ9GRC4_9NEOP|nr:hypothetical protein PR048_025414 [Dryococelus australis]
MRPRVEDVESLRKRILAGRETIRSSPGNHQRVLESMQRRLGACPPAVVDWRSSTLGGCSRGWDSPTWFHAPSPIERRALASSESSLKHCRSPLTLRKFGSFYTGVLAEWWRSPPTKANRDRFSAGLLPDFHTDGAVGKRVFSGIFHLPRPCIPVLLHIHLVSPLPALRPLYTGISNARLHHRGSKLDPRSDLRSTQKTVAPFEFRAVLEIEMVSACRQTLQLTPHAREGRLCPGETLGVWTEITLTRGIILSFVGNCPHRPTPPWTYCLALDKITVGSKTGEDIYSAVTNIMQHLPPMFPPSSPSNRLAALVFNPQVTTCQPGANTDHQFPSPSLQLHDPNISEHDCKT